MVCGHGCLVRLLSIHLTPRETMLTRGEKLGAPVLLVTPSVQHQVYICLVCWKRFGQFFWNQRSPIQLQTLLLMAFTLVMEREPVYLWD